MKRDYESLFILKPDFTEEEVDSEVKGVKDVIEGAGGQIIEEDRWGKRRLAYLVKKHRYGYYVLLRHSLDSEALEKLNRHFRLNENILKSMTVIFDEAAGRVPAAQAHEGGEESSSGDDKEKGDG